jgi:phosphatidylethanolamine-binding protein (PEBP) family uncharacterized protein
MRGLSNAIASAALITALAPALIGCGESSSSGASSGATPEGITLASPAMERSRAIPIKYTCDGQNVSLPLIWSGVPSATRELALFLFSLELTNPRAGQRTVSTRLIAQWAVAGLQPTSHELRAGALPPGAVRGRNESGRRSYSVCPAKGTVENYLFLIYALPTKLSHPHSFTDAELFEQAEHTGLAHGRLFASYKRL